MTYSRTAMAVLLIGWWIAAGSVWAQSSGPSPSLSISCTGTVCTLDASASTGNGPMTFMFECNRLPPQPGCENRAPASKVTVNYPNDGNERMVRVTVYDVDSVSRQSDWLTFRPGAPTPTPTLPPTATSTVTLTPTATPTSTPSPTGTDTPTPMPTATSTPAACPGIVVGTWTIADNVDVLMLGCVKPRDGTPWPARIVFDAAPVAP